MDSILQYSSQFFRIEIIFISYGLQRLVETQFLNTPLLYFFHSLSQMYRHCKAMGVKYSIFRLVYGDMKVCALLRSQPIILYISHIHFRLF